MKRALLAGITLALLLAVVCHAVEAQETRESIIIGPDEAVTGEPVTFSAELENDSYLHSYQWFFDGGNVTYGSSVSYSFDTTGNHTVRLLVWNVSDGASTELVYNITKYVEVKPDQSGMFLAVVGAGLAVGISGMGAGIGVGIAGSAGAGALVDRPKKFSKFFVFQALPQTQAIYGLLVAILIFLTTGLLTGEVKEVTFSAGLLYVAAGLAVGVAGLSAIGQGIAAGAGIGAYAEKDEMFTRGLIFSVLPETQAIYGLIIAVLILFVPGEDPTVFGAMADSMGGALIAIGASLAVGIAGLSAIGQGICAGAGISSFARKSETFTKSLIFSAMSETFAIFGLLIAILAMLFTGFF
ncbi:MAG: PKD domain-containing protein [Thermoplasmata archaeon]|nr:PKD domain-containing protein [Thermoplasmata archaeon]